MKVQCSGCKAAFQINDSKIPEKGAYAICPKCKTRFYIKKEPKAKKEQQEIIACPFCYHLMASNDICLRCGRIFLSEPRR
ncbi:MAG: zinc-ribbon domain-containing protein [Deltaproteobacteria bacterium]|nr:zinc-ribbon domain-containing protein [Deltaproteobacteria bacterium]